MYLYIISDFSSIVIFYSDLANVIFDKLGEIIDVILFLVRNRMKI